MRNAVFYLVASTVVWAIATFLGASWGMAFMASLVVPPLLLIIFVIAKYKQWV